MEHEPSLNVNTKAVPSFQQQQMAFYCWQSSQPASELLHCSLISAQYKQWQKMGSNLEGLWLLMFWVRCCTSVFGRKAEYVHICTLIYQRYQLTKVGTIIFCSCYTAKLNLFQITSAFEVIQLHQCKLTCEQTSFLLDIIKESLAIFKVHLTFKDGFTWNDNHTVISQ